MKCSKFQEWVSLEIDQQLPPEHVRPLQDHLQACEDCREFREDLQIGLRMLHATDPELPDNFDWKLQLRLSQTLRETARDAEYPWQEEGTGWRRWIGRAGLSAGLGLAAVLAFAMLVPGQMVRLDDRGGSMALADEPLRLPVQTVDSSFLDGSRRPLDPFGAFRTRAGGLQRSVSLGNRLGTEVLPSYSDLDRERIRNLENEVQIMRRRMGAKDLEIHRLQATLDSLTGRAVDTD